MSIGVQAFKSADPRTWARGFLPEAGGWAGSAKPHLGGISRAERSLATPGGSALSLPSGCNISLGSDQRPAFLGGFLGGPKLPLSFEAVAGGGKGERCVMGNSPSAAASKTTGTRAAGRVVGQELKQIFVIRESRATSGL